MDAQTAPNPPAGRDSDFGLDVRITEAGYAVNALLCSTGHGYSAVGG
jgi:hypothetical protein